MSDLFLTDAFYWLAWAIATLTGLLVWSVYCGARIERIRRENCRLCNGTGERPVATPVGFKWINCNHNREG